MNELGIFEFAKYDDRRSGPSNRPGGSQRGNNGPLKPNWRMILFYLATIMIFLFLIQLLYPSSRTVDQMDFTRFWNMAMAKPTPVKEVIIDQEGKLRVITADHVYEVNAPWIMTGDYVSQLVKNGIEVTGKISMVNSWWLNILFYTIPTVAIIIFWLYMMRRMGGGSSQAFSFTKSPANVASSTEKRVTFKDVAGVDEAEEELEEVVNFLKNPAQYTSIGAKLPKGILLVGPPGTGKTLLARAVSGEANVPFFHMSGSDFVELFVGVGAARVRDLFKRAKQSAPAIIFIDELDAVGRQRGAGLGGGHDEREQTLNQLLVEMDGFDVREGIVLMAATNRPDILDRALLRPGRIDKKVVVDPPDIRGREAILKIHMRGKPIDPSVDTNVLARRTPGFVGADLESLVNESALLAVRNGKKTITMNELEEAIDRVIAGPERKSRVISQKEREIIAYHEVGHALVSSFLPHAEPIHKISIIPRGYRALGYTLQLPVGDKYLTSKNELIDKITGLLGGRAAEEVIFNEITTGAANDIEVATGLAHKMVCEFGMSERLGPLSYKGQEEEVFLGRDISKLKNYSEKTSSEVDEEVRNLIEDCYSKAKKIIKEHKKDMDRIVSYLLKHEIIERDEFTRLLKGEEPEKEEKIEDKSPVREVN